MNKIFYVTISKRSPNPEPLIISPEFKKPLEAIEFLEVVALSFYRSNIKLTECLSGKSYYNEDFIISFNVDSEYEGIPTSGFSYIEAKMATELVREYITEAIGQETARKVIYVSA